MKDLSLEQAVKELGEAYDAAKRTRSFGNIFALCAATRIAFVRFSQDHELYGYCPLSETKELATLLSRAEEFLETAGSGMTGEQRRWLATYKIAVRVRSVSLQALLTDGAGLATRVLNSHCMPSRYDVFLAFNSKDRDSIQQIAQALRRRKLKVWLDEEEMPPGRPWQEILQQAIRHVKSAAIFIGKHGTGPWQNFELRGFLTQWVKRRIPVIPVLLPGVKKIPEHLIFLKEFHQVVFNKGINEPSSIDKLVWGIRSDTPRRRT